MASLDVGPATHFGSRGGPLASRDAGQVHVDGNIEIRGTQCEHQRSHR